MSLQHAYAVGNLALGRTFEFFGAGAGSNLAALADGRQDRRATLPLNSSTSVLRVDLGEAREVSVIALLHSTLARLPEWAGLTVEAADDFVTFPNLVTAGQWLPDTSGQVHRAFQFPPVTRRCWLISIDTSAAATLQVGELLLGSSTALSRATVYGAQRSTGWRTRVSESDTGQLFGHVLGGPQETRGLVWADLAPEERAELQAMHSATYGGALPLLWLERYSDVLEIEDPASRECLYGHLRESALAWTEADFGIEDAVSLTLTEASRGVGASP